MSLQNKKFYEKWKDVLETHYPNAENVFVARERSYDKKTILKRHDILSFKHALHVSISFHCVSSLSSYKNDFQLFNWYCVSFYLFLTSNQNSVGTSYICFCLFVFISKREKREMIGDEKEHTCSLWTA